MTFTLSDITYRLAREALNVREGTATGGSTTTIVDTNDRDEPDDYWNNGTAWVIYDGAGASAAPEGEYSVISDFVNSTSTLTLRTTLTAAVAATDRYALADKRIPLNILEQSVNRALQDMGKVVLTDTTSLDTADNQTEYTLPAAAGHDLREVWIESNKDDADDNRWQRIYNWTVEKTATGTANTLIFPTQWASGYDVKLVYVDYHPELYSASDELDESVPIERIIYKAAFHALSHLYMRDASESVLKERDRYEQLARDHEIKSPLKLPQRTGKLIIPLRGPMKDEGEPDRVTL